jgi:hypothetical protein
MAKAENFAINAYGRFVSGDLLEKKKTDHLGKPINDPEKHKFNFGIAFRKDDPALKQYFNEVFAYLSTAWATDPVKIQALNHYFAINPQTGYHNMVGLSMKMSDGDLPTGTDKTVNKNTAGHVVLWCSTKYPPKVTDTAYQEIPTESMKRGYYCAIAGTYDDNELAYSADGKGAGIYLNIKALILNAEGDVIEGGGIDVQKAMSNAGQLGAMPTGARALGSGVGVPNGMPGMTTGSISGQQPQGMPSANAGVVTHQNGMVNAQGVVGAQPMNNGSSTMPVTNPNAVQGQPQMGTVGMQGTGGVQQNVMPGTVSHGNVQQQQMPNAHPGILGNPGQQQVQQPVQQPQGIPQMGAPANMGMPGQ